MPRHCEVTQTLFRDAAGAIIGIVDQSGTSIARAPIVIPEQIKVGDGATLGTLDNYSGSTLYGTTVVSYTVRADTGSSVLVELTYVTTGLARDSIQTDTITYRLDRGGPLQLRGHQITSPEATLLIALPT